MAIVAQTSKYGKSGRTVLAWAVGLLFFFPLFWSWCMRITLQTCCGIVDLVLALHAEVARLNQGAIEQIFNRVELYVRTFYRLQQEKR